MPGIEGEILAGLLILDKRLLQDLDSSNRYKLRIPFRPLHGRVFHWHVLATDLKLNHELEAGVSILEVGSHFVTQEVWSAAIDVGRLRIRARTRAVRSEERRVGKARR